MESTFKNYDFIQLVTLKNYDLRENIPVADLFHIIAKYIKKQDVPKDEILTKCMAFISERLLPVFDFDLDLAKLLDELFFNLFDTFEIVINSISRNQRTIESSQILHILNTWSVIFEKLEIMNSMDFISISVFIEYGLKFLDKYFSLVQNLDSQVEVDKEKLNKILQQSLKIHSQVLGILENNVENLLCQSNSSEVVKKILKALLRLIKTLVTLNIISCTITLKLFLKLNIANAPFFENQTEKKFDWLVDAVKFLCSQIHFLLMQFNKEEFVEQPLSDITKYLKISSFFAQCIIKLTEHFDVQNMFGFNCVIPVFFEIFRLRRTVNPEILNLIEQHLTVHIIALIENVYKTEDFIGEFLKKSHDPIDNCGFCVLGLQIMERLVIIKDEYEFSVYFYGQFFEVLFEKISNCPEIFLLKEFYLKLEATMISLLNLYYKNSDVMKTFEQILVRGILKFDLILARVCFDIWAFLAKSVDGETCYQYFKFWVTISESFSQNCFDPRKVQIKYLVKVLYECLPKVYKMKAWREVTLVESNLIFELGIDKIFDESKRLTFKNSLLGNLIQNLKSITDCNKLKHEIYFDLINLFSLLSECKIMRNTVLVTKPNMLIPGLVIDCMKIILHETDLKKHEYFINVFIQFLLRNIDCFSETEKSTLCDCLSHIVGSSTNPCTKLYLQKFLQSAVQLKCNKIINKGDALVELLASESASFEDRKFYLITQLTALEPINLPLIWDCNERCEYNTKSKDSNETHPFKKIKLNEDNYQTDDYELINGALKTAREISSHFKVNYVSSRDLDRLKEIIALYENIVNQEK